MKTDILIIGGGIAGLSAAATLAPQASVTLLEAENALGYHATGRSAAMYLKDYGNDVVRALNHASQDHHQNADGGVLSPRGMLLVGRRHEREEFMTDQIGFGMDEISIDQALDKIPILNAKTCAFTAYREDAFDLDADRLLQNYTKTARRAGAAIIQNARVSSIDKIEGGWQVSTADQTYTASLIINAAGAWVDEIARLAGITPLGFQPYRRSIARLPAPGGHDTSGWPMLDGANERWYAKPDAGKWIVSPADQHPVDPHDAWADDLVLAEGLDRYAEMVSEPVTRLETSWAGLRTFAPDRTLVIGADVAQPTFYWLGGQGGYGLQTSPAASRLIADLITGQAPELGDDIVAALGPQRFG